MMALPRTPDFDKIKPVPLPSTLASPISPALSEKSMAEQSHRVRGLPTPKTTPRGDAVIESFKDVQLADIAHATQVSIDRLTSGLIHTADFVPSWPGSKQGFARPSSHADGHLTADSLVPTTSSHTNRTGPLKGKSGLNQAVALQHLQGPERRPPQAETASKAAQHAAPSSTGSPSRQHTPPTASNGRTTTRKATFGFNHADRAKTLERYIAFRPIDLPFRDDLSHTAEPRSQAKANLAWINSKLNRQEGGRFIAELDKYNHNLNCRLQATEDAAARIVARGDAAWNRWNVPRCELSRELKRWEAEQSQRGSVAKPKSYSRSQVQKSARKPPPPLTAPMTSNNILTSQTAKRRHAQDEEPSSPDSMSIGSQEGSEYVDRPLSKRTKTAVAKSERSLREQEDGSSGRLAEEAKAAAAKRRRPGEDYGKPSTSIRPKKSKPAKKGTTESTGARRGSGEAKAKNAKDKRLGDIKYWLCSKTKKFFPPKKPGDPVTPDHKGDWETLNFVRLPEWGSKIDTADLDFDEKLGPKGEYHGGDPTDLHRQEQELARLNNLTYDQYRCQKRRIFAARAVFDRIAEVEGHSPSWGRTQTQLVGSIDANKSSYLYSNFERWGWFDTVRVKWDDQYLDRLVADFQGYFRQPWTPPSDG